MGAHEQDKSVSYASLAWLESAYILKPQREMMNLSTFFSCDRGPFNILHFAFREFRIKLCQIDWPCQCKKIKTGNERLFVSQKQIDFVDFANGRILCACNGAHISVVTYVRVHSRDELFFGMSISILTDFFLSWECVRSMDANPRVFIVNPLKCHSFPFDFTDCQDSNLEVNKLLQQVTASRMCNLA